jgi:hypothetical protein
MKIVNVPVMWVWRGLKQRQKRSSPEGKRKERGLISNHSIEGAIINTTSI